MPKPKTDDLIALICKAASEKYREDEVKPGVQIAHIPAVDAKDVISMGGMAFAEPEPAYFYVALHRYPNQRECPNPVVAARIRESPFRKVVYTAKHEELDRAVQLLALHFLPVEAQAELADAIKGIKP